MKKNWLLFVMLLVMTFSILATQSESIFFLSGAITVDSATDNILVTHNSTEFVGDKYYPYIDSNLSKVVYLSFPAPNNYGTVIEEGVLSLYIHQYEGNDTIGNYPIFDIDYPYNPICYLQHISYGSNGQLTIDDMVPQSVYSTQVLYTSNSIYAANWNYFDITNALNSDLLNHREFTQFRIILSDNYSSTDYDELDDNIVFHMNTDSIYNPNISYNELPVEVHSDMSSTLNKECIIPNPCDGNITLMLLNSDLNFNKVDVYDMKGRFKFSTYCSNIERKKVTINIDKLHSGVFFLKINYTDGSTVTRKITVIK